MKEPFVEYVTRTLPENPVLFACGLPASYKTETTEVIAEHKGYTILRTDLIRLEVLKGEDIFDEKVASNMDKRKLVYDEMFLRADELAARGDGVILDATFVTQELRLRAAAVAAANDRLLVVHQVTCPEEVSLGRIARRTKENYESNAISPVAYYNNVKKFEPVDLADLKGRHPDLRILHTMTDTSSDRTDEWFVVSETRT